MKSSPVIVYLIILLSSNDALAQINKTKDITYSLETEIESSKFINIENASKNGNTIQVFELNTFNKQLIVFYEPTPGLDRYNVIIKDESGVSARYFRVNDTDVTWGYINEPGGPIKAVYYNEEAGEILIKKKKNNSHRILRPYSRWNNRSKILHMYGYMKKNPMLIRAKECNSFSEKISNNNQKITYGNWGDLIITNGIKPNTITLLKQTVL